MADPNIPIQDDDIRYEDRGGAYVLVDPTLPAGSRDVASAWHDEPGLWRWRMMRQAHLGEPYPTAGSRQEAMEDMLIAYARNAEVAARLVAQRPRFSFGAPQIVRVD